MTSATTVERLFGHYQKYTRRATPADPATRRLAFGTFERTLKGSLPEDHRAAILDIGCGSGALLHFLGAHGYHNLRGFDISPENVEICRAAGLAFVEHHNALETTSFAPGAQFDTIFALDVLEHIPKPAAAGFIEQVRQRLRPGGMAVVQTVNAGNVHACFHWCNDLSHEFAVSERSAVDLFMVGGFDERDIEVLPAWSATTAAGLLREVYLRLLHQFIWLAEGSARPRIETRNILIRACRR